MKITEQIKAAFSKILDESGLTGEKRKEFFEKSKKLFAEPEAGVTEPEAEAGEPAVKEYRLKDGTIVKVSGELIAGSKVMVVDAAQGEIPAPDGDHELEDGTIISTKGGMIENVTAPMVQNKFISYLESDSYMNKETFADGADYPWDECIANAMKEYGDEETANKVCAAIKNRSVAHAIENKLAADVKAAVQLIAENIKSNSLYSYALSKLACKDCAPVVNTEVESLKVENAKLIETLSAKEKEMKEMKEVSTMMADIFKKLEETPSEKDEEVGNKITFGKLKNSRLIK